MARVISPYAMGSDIVRRQKAYTKDDFIKTKVIFRLLFVVAFMAILSLFYIWSRVQIVQYGYEINRLQVKQRLLLEENKRLKMEVATFKTPHRIETLAREQLKMEPAKAEHMLKMTASREVAEELSGAAVLKIPLKEMGR